MKLFSFLPAAVLAALSASAHAQSAVTLFGVADAALTRGTGSGAGATDRTQLTSGGLSTSRIGMRGTEDLGGGMAAAFWLEAGISLDTGLGGSTSTNNQAAGTTAAGAGTQGIMFNRRSTVSLMGNWGELRLGRDYNPQFWNLFFFDPFGSVGVGTSLAHIDAYGANPIGAGGPYARGGGVNGLGVRSSNSIGYLLPSQLGGVYGQAQYFMGENPQNSAANEKDGSGFGLRLGYMAGPLNVAASYQLSKFAAGDVRASNIGASWDFGIAKASALYNRDSAAGQSGSAWVLGTNVPVGSGEVRASYSQLVTKAGAVDARARKFALGYVHNLSKRTAVYTTYARVTNSGGQSIALGGATTAVNQPSSGFDVGIRHTF